MCVLAATRKRRVAQEHLLQTHSTFNKSVMVAVGVSKLAQIDMIFIDAKVKFNGAYYRDVLLTQKLLLVMRVICGEFFIFQQGNVPAHWVCETINLQERDTCIHFTRPFATQQHRSEPGWQQNTGRNAAAGLTSSWCWWTEAALDWCLASMMQLISGMNVCEYVWKEDHSSIYFNLNNAYLLHILFVNFVNLLNGNPECDTG